MTIITNHHREQIADAVVKHGFSAEIVDIADEANRLKRELYDRVYSAECQAAIALLQRAMSCNFQSTAVLGLSVGGANIKIGFYRSGGSGLLERCLPTEAQLWFDVVSQHSHGRLINLPADDELGVRIMDHVTKRSALNVSMAERRAEVIGVLSVCRTDGQLQARWPEVMPIAKNFIKVAPKIQLPAVNTAVLNKAMGLPPAEQLAA